jgi:hypothetical protein
VEPRRFPVTGHTVTHGIRLWDAVTISDSNGHQGKTRRHRHLITKKIRYHASFDSWHFTLRMHHFRVALGGTYGQLPNHDGWSSAVAPPGLGPGKLPRGAARPGGTWTGRGPAGTGRPATVRRDALSPARHTEASGFFIQSRRPLLPSAWH